MDRVVHTRTALKHIVSRGAFDGSGARVYRSIGESELPTFDPFLMLDEFDVKPPGGFPPHPHRGQSTVTYMLEGFMEHEDFRGHRGAIGPGDLQWMVAGRGILHSEMPSGDGRAHGLQLWVNLPKREKACKPSYQELKAEAVPRVTQDGVTATIIAGTAFGTTSPVRTKTPTMFLDFKMERGSTLTQAIPYAWNAFLYVLSGSVRVGGSSAAAADEGDAPTAGGGERHDDGILAEAHTTVTLSCGETEDGVFIRAVGRGAHFVLIAGEPIGEPVVQHGPFVVTSREEVERAIDDYSHERHGFEGAHAFVREWKTRHGGK